MDESQWAMAEDIACSLYNLVRLAHADSKDGRKQILTPAQIQGLVQSFDGWLQSRIDHYREHPLIK
jgi:hypothetical protein